MKNKLLKKFSAFIVTAMLFSVSTNAQIVYTDVNPDTVISSPVSPTPKDYNLDLNNDGVNDYKISVSLAIGGACFTARFYIFYVKATALNANAVVAVANSTYPQPMNFNDSIVSGLTFSTTGYLRYERTSNQFCSGTTQGYWPLLSDCYLGLKLIVGANTYYGWARMQVSFGYPATCTIKEYAYNSIPNQPILAGETGTGPTGIFENSFASSINLFPNPADNHFTIALGSSNQKVEVIITDITGKIIYSTTSTDVQKIEVNTTDFATGIYVVQIQAADFIASKKLIIEK